jgi:hypothetical protein
MLWFKRRIREDAGLLDESLFEKAPGAVDPAAGGVEMAAALARAHALPPDVFAGPRGGK